MEVLNNPSLEAEEWKAGIDTCSQCGGKNKGISIDDVFPQYTYNYTKYFYKCGFCLHPEEIRVPKSVQYEISKRGAESSTETRSVPQSEPKKWRYLSTCVYSLITAVLIVWGVTEINAGNKSSATVLLLASNVVAVATGMITFIDDQR